MRPRDTSPAAHHAQLEAYRRMSASERLALALEMGDDLRTVTADGVRARHPEYDMESVQAAVVRLSLGTSTFRAVFSARKPVAP